MSAAPAPALPAGNTPEARRAFTELSRIGSDLANSGAFLIRQAVTAILKPQAGAVALRWCELNRISLTTDTSVMLPRIDRRYIGVPLYVAKLSATGSALVVPTGRGMSLQRAPQLDGASARVISSPGLYCFVTDGVDWFSFGTESRRRFDVTIFGASTYATAERNNIAFQLAITAAGLVGGGVVWVPAGRYRLSVELTNRSDYVTVEGEGDATILDYSSAATQFIGLATRGSQAAGVALAANVAEGSDDLNVASTGFATDDWVKVYSSAVTGSTNVPKGEVCRIADAATMVLYDPLCDSYATADTASVAKLTLVKGATYKNFKIVGPADNTVNFSGILCDYTEGARIENVTCERCHFYGVGIQDSTHWGVEGCDFSRSEAGGLAYGVAVYNAAQDGTITNVRGRRLRHLVTHGGFSSRNGVPRRTVTSNSVASQMRNSGFDSHAGAEDISFDNCTVFGSESDGFTLECVSATVSNCTVRDSLGPAFHLHPLSLKPYRVTISNANVSGKGYSTSRSAYQIQMEVGYELVDGISISGGAHSDCRYGLRTIITVGVTGRIKNLSINGGAYKDCGLDADAVIKVIQAQGVAVSGAVIEDSTNSVDGVSLEDVTDFSVQGNVIRLPGTGGCRGVRGLTTTTVGTIGSNTIDTGASGTGIALADTCTNVTVANDNDLRGCPTAVVFGTGAGHVYNQPPGISADRGDVDILLTHNDAATQRFNTALTSNADITLPGANVRMRFRVVRQAGATGAFNVNVGALKSLTAASTWCEVESDGTNYILTAAGAL